MVFIDESGLYLSSMKRLRRARSLSPTSAVLIDDISKPIKLVDRFFKSFETILVLLDSGPVNIINYIGSVISLRPLLSVGQWLSKNAGSYISMLLLEHLLSQIFQF